jgi:hypothetical protein
MKWLDSPPDAALPPDALLKRLIAETTEATGHPPSLKDVDIDALGNALRRVLAARGETAVDAIRVIELSARTLGDLGAGDMARRLLMFGSGLVTPAVWEVSGGGKLWILDLRRLAVDAGVQIELTVFRSLDAAIAAMADVWDASDGQGRLGLRHVHSTAAHLLGDVDPRGRRSQPLAREILERSRARLHELAAARHWQHVPEVLNLG